MSDSNQIPRSPKDLPSSPQFAGQRAASQQEPDSPTLLSPTATLGHSSPELPPLPDLPPLGGYPTPGLQSTGASETTYYTASWGSPYQNPPPRSIASNLADASSDIEEDSPNPRFGLSHLLPSRLPKVSRIPPSRPSTPSPGSPPQSPTKFSFLASPSKSIKSFFSSPTRPEASERRGSASTWNLRSGWWNATEDSKDVEFISSPPLASTIEEEPELEPFKLDGTADTLARTERLRAKGHRSRDSNLTLTQEDFWPKINFQEAIGRTKMYASRYANPEHAAPPTPPPKDTPKKVDAPVDVITSKLEDASNTFSAEVATPSPTDRITPPVQLQRTDSSSSGRIKKTVKYRGKNVHINIPPRVGGVRPMSKEEVDAKMLALEKAGYSTQGFDNWASGDEPGRYQNRGIHPDPEDDLVARRQRQFKVLVPNKALWDEYVAFLREEKLRMLGVSLGGPESTESPLSARPGSTQYTQSLPFSPPLPTSSAGSQRHGHRASVFQTSFVPPSSGHASSRSMASPMPGFGHMHRQSMFSPPTMPMHSMTPPILQALSPRLLETLSRGSPGPELSDRRSPGSPFGVPANGQGFPFNQRNDLLVQMQRQKEQQLAMQMQQQMNMQQMLASSARPASTLQEVPEAEDEDESMRPQLRSRQGEPPEIINPKPSHRHNISVKLEQDAQTSDYHLEESIKRQIEEESDVSTSNTQHAKIQLPQRTTSLQPSEGITKMNGGVLAPVPEGKQDPAIAKASEKAGDEDEKIAPSFGIASGAEAANPWANDPTFFKKHSRPSSESKPLHQQHSSSKSSVSRLNVAAKEFSPSSQHSFNPGIFSKSAFAFTPASEKPFGGAARKASVSPPQHSFKKSFSSLSAAAPAFNPQAASFNPGGFGGFGSASTFTPSKSEFSFTSSMPVFTPTAPVFQPPVVTPTQHTPIEQKQSIFGNIDVSAEGKKAKKSKALPIVDPLLAVAEPKEETLLEDEDGRLIQGDDRQKRARTVDDDGDNVPLFALPPEELQNIGKPPAALASEAKEAEEHKDLAELDADELPEAEAEKADGAPQLDGQRSSAPDVLDSPEDVALNLKASPISPASSEHGTDAPISLDSSTKDVQSGSTSRVFSNSSTLSATAAPFDFKPSFVIDEGLKNRMASRLQASSRDSTKLAQSIEPATPRSNSSQSKTANEQSGEDVDEIDHRRERLPSSVRYFDDDQDQPSFREIDDIMQHMNEQGSDAGIERDEPSWPNSSSPQFDVSPLPSSPQPHTFQMPLARSDAPSPSPRRPMITKTRNLTDDDSASITQDPFSDGRAIANYDSPAIRNLVSGDDQHISDWDDVVSSGQEHEFRQKAEFFGPHVSTAIKSAMDAQLLAFENRFNDVLERQVSRMQQPSRRARSRVTVDSDADDEDDDVETDAYSRGFSPKRDRRMEKFRVMLQETLAAQRSITPPPQDLSHYDNLLKAMSGLQAAVGQKSDTPSSSLPSVEDLKAMIEESVAQQNEALIKRREEAIKTQDEERFAEIADGLKDAATRIAAEIEARSEAERREAETSRLLKITEEELALVKETAREDSNRLRTLEEAAETAKAAETDSHSDLSKKLMNLAMDNEALRETLDEYRLSSDKWRQDIDDATAEKEKIHAAFGALRLQADEALHIRETMRQRIEKLQQDMSAAVGQVAAERAKWTRSDAEQRTRYEILAARAEAEARTRERFERELERLESQERDAYRLKAALDHEQKQNVKLDQECEHLSTQLKELQTVKLELVQTQKENTRLEELVEQLKAESAEHSKTADHYAREFREARETGRLEVERTRGLMQIDIETANNQVNIVRAELDAEVARVRGEMDNLKLDTDTLRAKHELDLEQAADAKRDALEELRKAKDEVFSELRQTFEERLEELRKQHRRDLDHTIENKNQSETFLRESHSQELQDLQDHHERTLEQAINEKEFSEHQLHERLTLADSKIDHLQDKVLHLEEKLEIAKTAAHAAAQAAQSAKTPSAPAAVAAAVASAPAAPRLPEKISPQALRESIAVLQEQLQEREIRIESLEQELSEVDKEAPAKIKAKETEIGWLRELIGVRVDDLADLVNVLSQPSFDREAVRNAAIRIRASIQMEQDAKERQMNGPANFPTLASISNFASPKAAQLAAAIGSWRRGGGGIAPSNLAQSVSSISSSRTQTPSKPVTTAQNFLNGLMTPPASSLRKTPSPDPSVGASRPRPLGPPRPLGSKSLEKRRMSRESEVSAGPSTPPLLAGADYDQDAEESTTGYYDDEESTVEGTPRAERLRAFEPFPAEVDR